MTPRPSGAADNIHVTAARTSYEEDNHQDYQHSTGDRDVIDQFSSAASSSTLPTSTVTPTTLPMRADNNRGTKRSVDLDENSEKQDDEGYRGYESMTNHSSKNNNNNHNKCNDDSNQCIHDEQEDAMEIDEDDDNQDTGNVVNFDSLGPDAKKLRLALSHSDSTSLCFPEPMIVDGDYNHTVSPSRSPQGSPQTPTSRQQQGPTKSPTKSPTASILPIEGAACAAIATDHSLQTMLLTSPTIRTNCGGMKKETKAKEDAGADVNAVTMPVAITPNTTTTMTMAADTDRDASTAASLSASYSTVSPTCLSLRQPSLLFNGEGDGHQDELHSPPSAEEGASRGKEEVAKEFEKKDIRNPSNLNTTDSSQKARCLFAENGRMWIMIVMVVTTVIVSILMGMIMKTRTRAFFFELTAAKSLSLAERRGSRRTSSSSFLTQIVGGPGGVVSEKDELTSAVISDVTLRDYLSDPNGFYLAMAPAFFGFYAYFGALIALDEGMDGEALFRRVTGCNDDDENLPAEELGKLKGVSGASAGAIAAIMLGAGIRPRHAANMAMRMNLNHFADPPGFFAAMKGDKFEAIMKEFFLAQKQMTNDGFHSSVTRTKMSNTMMMEDAAIPVAVTGFDLLKFREKVITSGSMVRAARASATFPGLFQPVPWWDDDENDLKGVDVEEDCKVEQKATSFLSFWSKRWKSWSWPTSLLIDGGITDTLGFHGLAALNDDFHSDSKMAKKKKKMRVINLSVGSFAGLFGLSTAPGPALMMSRGIDASSVLSLSIVNTPRCGPLSMSHNGPRAVKASQLAMSNALDRPLLKYNGKDNEEEVHYVLEVDASEFL